MAPGDPSDLCAELQRQYDLLTARRADLDRDASLALSEYDRAIHRDRRALVEADRETVQSYLVAIEKDEPLPGPWPVELVSVEHDPLLRARLAPPVSFKPPGRRDFFTHFPGPDNYIPRPDLLAGVRAALLDGTGGIALTSSITVRTKADALHGMGGIGKSVAARALCDDPAVQAAFPDGILWATLGQTPDVLARLREWIDVLGGIVSENAPTVERMTAILADLLKNRTCLLIVDDVWKKAHVEPFRVGGARCRLLLTTRDAARADEVGAAVHPVPVMAPAEAVALLEQWAGEGLRDTATEIVRRLGYLPLAIRLAGAQLRRKDPAAWLTGFDAAKLAARRVEQVHDSLKATFDLSLDELSADDRRLYVALAIFKEDEPAPAVAIARLWSGLEGRNEEETTELLEDLAARALVQSSPVDGATVTVHDLLRDFMEAELSTEGRLTAHRALLDAYRRTQQGAGWATAPDDGYLYDHLAYHLDAIADHDPVAGEELRSLLADQAWMNVRVPQSRYLYDGYLADLDVVWRRAHAEAHRQIDAGEEPSAIGDCVRYALIRTSVNSLAANYVPELVARAVEVGLWPVERALSIAQRLPDQQARATMYTALLKLGCLSSSEHEQAAQLGVAAALAIGAEQDLARALALANLAPHLTGEARDRALEQGLAAALAISYEPYQAEALAALGPQLTGALLEQVLAVALANGSGRSQVEVLVALASRLRGEERDRVLEQGLTVALAIGSSRRQVQVLVASASRLTGRTRDRVLEQGLAAALASDNENDRAWSLMDLAPQLTGTLLEQGLAAALAIEAEKYRARALTALAPQLTGETRDRTLEQGLAAALAIGEEWLRARALADLAPQLTREAQDRALEQGLTAALASDAERYRPLALAALAPQLTGALLEQGLAAALIMSDGYDRALALTALALQLTGEARDRALEQGLAAAMTSDYEEDRVEALAALLPHLTGETRDRALEQGLAAALAIGEEYIRAKALRALAPKLTGSPLEQGLAAALIISDGYDRALVLAALAPQLAADARDRALAQGLAAALAIGDEWLRARALAALVPHLTGETRDRALEQGLAAALAIGYESLRAQALADLVSQLTGETGNRALEQGLAAALATSYEPDQMKCLAALAPQLTGALLEQGLAAALIMSDGYYRALALAALAPQLTAEARDQALEQGLAAALSMEHVESRAEVLTAFLPAITDRANLVALIRSAAIDQIHHHLAKWTRPDLLYFLSAKNLFAPPILNRSFVNAIALHIIEVCHEWTWL